MEENDPPLFVILPLTIIEEAAKFIRRLPRFPNSNSPSIWPVEFAAMLKRNRVTELTRVSLDPESITKSVPAPLPMVIETEAVTLKVI